MRQATLTFPLFTIMFDIGWIHDQLLTFSPTTIVGRDGKPIAGWRSLLGTVPWKSELERNLRWGHAADAPVQASAPAGDAHRS
jgi:hypothetical protein